MTDAPRLRPFNLATNARIQRDRSCLSDERRRRFQLGGAERATDANKTPCLAAAEQIYLLLVYSILGFAERGSNTRSDILTAASLAEAVARYGP